MSHKVSSSKNIECHSHRPCDAVRPISLLKGEVCALAGGRVHAEPRWATSHSLQLPRLVVYVGAAALGVENIHRGTRTLTQRTPSRLVSAPHALDWPGLCMLGR